MVEFKRMLKDRKAVRNGWVEENPTPDKMKMVIIRKKMSILNYSTFRLPVSGGQRFTSNVQNMIQNTPDK